ncbi:RadC family protein [Macrococcus lamae]|uniref:JAB domain-containing protein n=1 Tax=Macrococcus lamae TaxID=198484 RepID=A0A4R6BXG1_9STAP|nr:DNA repair protein RadC [Macrococcus lamae]TDM13027.1 JAB domain-containing protein [Macrococcus lamae]
MLTMIEHDKPRERLMTYGPEQLTNQELLAIIINTGTKDETVLEVANKILNLVGNVRDLRYLTLQELRDIKGIGEKKAVTMLAMIELAVRMHTHSLEDKIRIKSPQCVADLLMERLRYYTQEHFIALYLNTKNVVIHEQVIFKGSLNASIVHPREVFREAVKRSAANIIVVHNHPSGDPTPSVEDIEATKRLMNCGTMFGIELLDHIIIGNGTFVSIKEKGLL